MNRKSFLKTSTILKAASLLPNNSVFSQNLAENERFNCLKFRIRWGEFVDNLFQIINWDNAADWLGTALKIQ